MKTQKWVLSAVGQQCNGCIIVTNVISDLSKRHKLNGCKASPFQIHNQNFKLARAPLITSPGYGVKKIKEKEKWQQKKP